MVNVDESLFQINLYKLSDAFSTEMLDDEAEVSAYQYWQLPSQQFTSLWQSLVFETNVKSTLLRYVETSVLFSRYEVDPNLVAWNKVILLHGPPGTGKTSLCKALAQKVTIRLSTQYPAGGYLVEINANSIFSKWFAESGKQLTKMFDKIHELTRERQSFVFILIDEVESLAAARSASLGGSEPSDSIRVVNALLTQIDRLKAIENVLIMTTSNLSEAIDLAFVDRADIKQYIGPPGQTAIYDILSTCINELACKELVDGDFKLLDYKAIQCYVAIGEPLNIDQLLAAFNDDDLTRSKTLWALSQMCMGMSGRSLRKLPFLAFSKGGEFPMSLKQLLAMMHDEIQQRRENISDFVQ